jgi:L,D-peptidoglycan transpeptidase YkuD (ErfK/YbiS/YcfS/YnhG family)
MLARRGLPLALLTTTVLALGASPAAASSAPAVSPNGMRGLGGVDRVVEISAWSKSSTHATARTFRLVDGHWRIVRRAMPARVGTNGFSRPRQRHAGDRTTPMGNYGFVYGFGGRRNPGLTGFNWRRLVPGSCWAGTRRRYNRWVHRDPCAPADENIWASHDGAYRYAMVIDFNYHDPVYGRGSGIFLHRQIGKSTAGCVALRGRDLTAVLRWLRPGTRILMGPASYLRSLKS